MANLRKSVDASAAVGVADADGPGSALSLVSSVGGGKDAGTLATSSSVCCALGLAAKNDEPTEEGEGKQLLRTVLSPRT